MHGDFLQISTITNHKHEDIDQGNLMCGVDSRNIVPCNSIVVDMAVVTDKKIKTKKTKKTTKSSINASSLQDFYVDKTEINCDKKTKNVSEEKEKEKEKKEKRKYTKKSGKSDGSTVKSRELLPVIEDDNEIWNLFGGSMRREFDLKNEESKSKLCEHCSLDKVILIDGDYVCQECGCIACRYIDHGAEWRIYSGDDNKGANMMRCGMPTSDLMPNAFLGSMIGFGNNTRETYEMRVMRRCHLWNSSSYKERSLHTIFDTLSLQALNKGIPKSIIEEAKALYKKISDLKITRGNNRCGLIAASIYIACKNNKVPRSIREIAGFFNVSIPLMTKNCKKFQEMLKTNLQSTTALDFASRFCSKMNLDKNKKNICIAAISKAEQEDLVYESTPPSIAAAIIYLCSIQHKWDIDRQQLADACEVSQVTILKCSKRLQINSKLFIE